MRRALVLYIATWLTLGGLVAAGALVVLRGDGHNEVSLPPVREIELELAAEQAGCERRANPRGGAEPRTHGPRADPAAPGFYDEAPSPSSLIGAMRHGAVVISYRSDATDEQRAELRSIQAEVPRGTIVAPNDRMPFEIAITAWRRLLACRRDQTAGTLDAIRLFRGRYLGSGPDSPR